MNKKGGFFKSILVLGVLGAIITILFTEFNLPLFTLIPAGFVVLIILYWLLSRK